MAPSEERPIPPMPKRPPPRGQSVPPCPTLGAELRRHTRVAAKSVVERSRRSKSKSRGAELCRPTPPRLVYRAMRGDKTDLVVPRSFRGTTVRTLQEDMAILALRAVNEGCADKSPFLHASWDYWVARKWLMKGRENGQHPGNYMVSIDLDHFESSRVVDLSSKDKMQAWLG